MLTQKIIEREFALSGSEQNPDLTGKSIRAGAAQRASARARPRRSRRSSATAPTSSSSARCPTSCAGMNALTDEPLLDVADVEREVVARDRRDRQPVRQGPPDHGHPRARAATCPTGSAASPRRTACSTPTRARSSPCGCSILTRKTLGGLQTDLAGRVLQASGEPLPGLYAAGEVAGFGGGGMHGYRSLEGTFLGGCLFSGRTAGRAVAAEVA